MTENEAIHKLEYSKKAYQTLIDEKVDSGKLVGDGVRGEWKAETPLNEVYKSMIDALDMAIKALEAQPCEDCISRQEAISAIIEEFYPNAIAIDIVDSIANLPSVTPKAKIGRWIDIQYFKADDTYYKPKCPFCGIEPKEYSNYCPSCGAKMQEVEE